LQKDMLSTSGLAGFDQLVRELGGHSEEALKRVEIDPSILMENNRAVAFTAVANLLEDVARALNCPDFGMRFAERQNLVSLMSPLDRLVRSAPTLGRATLLGIKNMAVYSPAIRETLEFDYNKNLFRLRYETRRGDLGLTPQLSERTLLLICNASFLLTGGKVKAREVWFMHTRVSPQHVYRTRFGSTVRFSQECDAVFFTGDDLRQKVVSSDKEAFRNEVKLVQTMFPAINDNIEIPVGDFLRDNLQSMATRKHLADHLGLSTRTLHRKLSAAGWTFESIRDDVRRNLAILYLARNDLTLTEVAGMLGYSELAVFSRSCQRWFCSTPGTLRRLLTINRFVPWYPLGSPRELEV
jgi:AraC-like DNA-binding protein